MDGLFPVGILSDDRLVGSSRRVCKQYLDFSLALSAAPRNAGRDAHPARDADHCIPSLGYQ